MTDTAQGTDLDLQFNRRGFLKVVIGKYKKKTTVP
jgi:hypothetical protein